MYINIVAIFNLDWKVASLHFANQILQNLFQLCCWSWEKLSEKEKKKLKQRSTPNPPLTTNQPHTLFTPCHTYCTGMSYKFIPAFPNANQFVIRYIHNYGGEREWTDSVTDATPILSAHLSGGRVTLTSLDARSLLLFVPHHLISRHTHLHTCTYLVQTSSFVLSNLNVLVKE